MQRHSITCGHLNIYQAKKIAFLTFESQEIRKLAQILDFAVQAWYSPIHLPKLGSGGVPVPERWQCRSARPVWGKSCCRLCPLRRTMQRWEKQTQTQLSPKHHTPLGSLFTPTPFLILHAPPAPRAPAPGASLGSHPLPSPPTLPSHAVTSGCVNRSRSAPGCGGVGCCVELHSCFWKTLLAFRLPPAILTRGPQAEDLSQKRGKQVTCASELSPGAPKPRFYLHWGSPRRSPTACFTCSTSSPPPAVTVCETKP